MNVNLIIDFKKEKMRDINMYSEFQFFIKKFFEGKN